MLFLNLDFLHDTGDPVTQIYEVHVTGSRAPSFPAPPRTTKSNNHSSLEEIGFNYYIYIGSILHYSYIHLTLQGTFTQPVMNMSEDCMFGPRLFSRFYERLDQRDKFINVHMYV